LCPAASPAQPGEAPVYETIVTAAPATIETPREDRAASSAVITADRTPRAAESVPQLLSEQSGVTVTRLGGMGSTATISLRGSTANQVLIYVDGVPLNTATGGGVDLGAIPLGDVERIEIYRGMSPIGFGASAIGGVVSLTTTVPKDNRAEFEAGGGSFGTAYGSARGAWNRGRFHLYTGAHFLTSEGDFPYINTQATPQNPDDDQAAWRRNNDLHQLDGMARAAVDLAGDRRLRISVLLFDRAQGLPGPGTLANPDTRLGTFRATGIASYESSQDLGPGGRLRAMAYGNYLLTHFADPDHQINASPTDARDRTYTAGGTLDWKRAARPWLTLAGVFDGRFDRFLPSDALAPTTTGAPGTRLFGAAGLESDLWARPLRLDVIASLRLEAAREETSGRDNFYALQPTSPPVNRVLPIARLSLIEEVAPWLSLRANGGRYARLPSLIELYGNTGYLLGNTDLRPETGFNADLGPLVSWKRGNSSVLWSTAAFASLVSDLISYQFGNGRARAQNLGSARIAGVESSATLELGRHARMVASATYTDARNTSPVDAQYGRQIPLRPRYRLYGRPEWRAVALGSAASLGIYADVDATADNYRDLPNSARVPSRLIFGAGLYADLPGGLCVRASGLNLTNSTIYDLINYPLPGRELYLTLAWSSATNKTKE
jgi:iron complex outermembrane receptor protein